MRGAMRSAGWPAALAAAALLAGCAASPHPDRPRSGVVAATCADQAQCELYWKRARDWVTANSKRAIRADTDWMLRTDKPGSLDIALSYQLMRWPGPDNSGEIRFEAGCSYFLPCNPSPAQAFADFSAYLKAP